MQKYLIVIFLLGASTMAKAQNSFVQYQRSFPRVAYAMQLKEDTLKKQFDAKGLQWPASQIYIRSFKYDGKMEVWVKGKSADTFSLFKTYKICALAGSIGPKRMEGDFQVPEGFYYINKFNPNSEYHLALGINYPNESDKVLGDPNRLGGGIYIHGSCVTVGCIPMLDPQIEEIYILATMAKNNGQDFIPVHIFPIKYDNPGSVEYFATATKNYPYLQTFSKELKAAFDYFDKTKKLPCITIDNKGDYEVM